MVINYFGPKVLSSIISFDIYNDNRGRQVVICHLTSEKNVAW